MTYGENLKLSAIDGASLTQNKWNASVVGVRASLVVRRKRKVVCKVEHGNAESVALRPDAVLSCMKTTGGCSGDSCDGERKDSKGCGEHHDEI